MKEGRDWFVNWFNTPYYHILYKNRSDKEAELFIKKICNELSISKNSQVLDLACGRGRHSRVLHQLGYKVTGVDLSTNSIDFANNYALKNLEFHKHDMRLPFKENFFDCIMNLFTSIGYFSNIQDNKSVINSCKIGLKQKGLLIIDFMNATKSIRNLKGHEIKTINNIEFKISRKVENKEIVKNILVKDNGKTFEFQERVTGLKLNDFKAYFRDSSLNLIHLFGDYDLSNFEEKSSNRLIMVCNKI